MRASSRASGAPMQKRSPCPKAGWPLGARATSIRSASGNSVESRFAEPRAAQTALPWGIRASPILTS